MTKLSNFFQNPFNKDFEDVKKAGEDVAGDRAAQAAAEIYGDKPFQVEYKRVHTIANLIALFSAFISFCTALFAVQSILYFTVGTILSWGAAVALCGLFEVLKSTLWKITVKQRLKYKRAAGGLILTLICLHTISLLSSGYGAYLIPTNFAPAELAKDSLSTQFAAAELGELQSIDKQIQNVDKQINDLTPFILTPSGRKSSVTAGQISTLQKQKGELIAQKAAAKITLEKSKGDHAAAMLSANVAQSKNIENIQYICLGFTLGFELLYLACTVFAFYYKFRVYIDSGAPATPSPSPAPKGAHPAPKGAHPARKKRKKPANTVGAHPVQIGAHPVQIGAHPAAPPVTVRKIGFNIGREDNPAPSPAAPKNIEWLAQIQYKDWHYKIVELAGAANKNKADLKRVIVAEIGEKMYNKDRVASNMRAAISKAENGEPAAAARADFWIHVRNTLDKYIQKQAAN